MFCLQVDFHVYYIHFEITVYPCNLIGSQQCDLFQNHTIFCPKSHLFLSQWERDSKTKQPITILFLCILLSFSFNWEEISNTQNSVWLLSKQLEVHQKYSATRHVIFSILFSAFGNVVKHGLSCLIYYVKDIKVRIPSIRILYWYFCICLFCFALLHVYR